VTLVEGTPVDNGGNSRQGGPIVTMVESMWTVVDSGGNSKQWWPIVDSGREYFSGQWWKMVALVDSGGQL
jgi:hypothetical protein